jgi:hypothetical protein
MAQFTGKDLVDLVDQWAPQLEKSLNQMATTGPKLLNKGRKIAKEKGASVPKKSADPKPLGGNVKKLIALGGLAALAYMGIRRLLGGGSDWQAPPIDEVEDPVID